MSGRLDVSRLPSPFSRLRGRVPCQSQTRKGETDWSNSERALDRIRVCLSYRVERPTDSFGTV